MVVVADTSPLLYLSRVGVLELLAANFGEVVVPEIVWVEVVERRPEAPGVGALCAATWLRVDSRPLPQADLGLDPGETAAILLAEAIHADILLIDERAGRAVAEGRGLSVRGTLGVLVQARMQCPVPAISTSSRPTNSPTRSPEARGSRPISSPRSGSRSGTPTGRNA